MARVFVGMSGGVDSSVAAALLVEQGHDVTGVYMKNWSQDLPGMHCPWAEDVADAKRVAVSLGIDFRVFDFEQQYRDRVVRYMIDEYKAGRTPNPDIMCNQEMKFKLFLEASLEQGAEMIATGHYARTEGGKLFKAHDTDKDQTYFLYRVESLALEKTLFPLGDYTKAEVREMAIQRHLWTASKKESMGICFVGKVGIRDFLSQYVEANPGNSIDKDTGTIVGQHDGAIFYTIGQRHGIGAGGGLPYYVVGKSMARNEVYVSTNLRDSAIWRSSFEARDAHWITEPPTADDGLQVRLRHRGELVNCEVQFGSQTAHDGEMSGQSITVKLLEPQRAITPGQSAVLYRGDEVLGGAIVTN